MPLLELEPFISPENLFELSGDAANTSRWWVLHTRPRAEKSLARKLCDRDLSFYLPLHSREWRNRGRRFQSHLPLFPGYLFMYGDFQSRLTALETNLVAHAILVEDQEQLIADLGRVHQLLSTGAPVTPEDRLEPGDLVEVIRGPLTGLEGKLLRRGRNLKFVIEVQFLRRAVSAEVESWMIQSLEHKFSAARAG
jgi:transcription antitermination factor NusG